MALDFTIHRSADYNKLAETAFAMFSDSTHYRWYCTFELGGLRRNSFNIVLKQVRTALPILFEPQVVSQH